MRDTSQRIDRLDLRGGDLKGCPLLVPGIGELQITPALQSPLKGETRPDLPLGGLPRLEPPADAGQVVRASVVPVDGQNQIADIPAHRRGAQLGTLAQRPAQKNAVVILLFGRAESAGKNRNDQPGPLLTPTVEGAHFTPDAKSLRPSDKIKLLGPERHVDPVLRAGQTSDKKGKGIKFL